MGVLLRERVPLRMPVSILIDPSNRCNFKCRFCPTGDKELLSAIGRKETVMGFDQFKKIINDLGSWIESESKRPNNIGLYKDGEPLINKRIIDFIRYAVEAKVSERVYMTTNGALLNTGLSEEIVDSGLTHIRISVEHVTDSGYTDITRTKVSYDQILDNVAMMWKAKNKKSSSLHIHAKIVGTYLKDEMIRKFESDFNPITDSTTIETIMGWSDSSSHDFSMGLVKHDQKRYSSKLCSQPFSRLAVCANGDITICCVDWAHSLLLGNVNNTSLKEAWNSEILRSIRVQHLTGNHHKESPCINCDYFKNQGVDDNIDSEINRLKSLYV